MSRLRCVVLLGAVACAEPKTAAVPYDECGPPVRTAAWDDSAAPVAVDAEGEVPLDFAGVDDGQDGVAWAAALAVTYQAKVQAAPDCVGDDGLPCAPFGYLYDPVEGVFLDDASIHRQLVAALGSLRVHALVQRPGLRRSAEAAVAMLVPHARTYADGTAAMGDLGATVLLAMVLAEHQRQFGPGAHEDLMVALGEHILGRIEPDGSFSSGSALQRQQAHQALWRLYEATGDSRHREALLAVARYYDENRDQNGVDEIWEWPYLYGLWAHEPLVELYRETGETFLPELVFWVTDQVVAGQYSDRAPGVVTSSCGWRGGFTPNSGSGPPNWNSTIKLEGVADAVRMAELAGDTERRETYAFSAEIGAAYLMQSQYRAGDVELVDFADPDRAVGGLPLFVDDPTVRIDIPGHGSIALAKVAAFVHKEDTPGRLVD